MNQQSNFKDVEDFHKKFGIHYGGPPRELPASLARFRMEFLNEEFKEYVDAVHLGDIEKQFDALLDLVYVAMGTALLQGFPWQNGWDEVQRANMEKQRVESAEDSKRLHKYDIKKPDGWAPPKIADVLNEAISKHNKE